jgi:hypothetical protein
MFVHNLAFLVAFLVPYCRKERKGEFAYFLVRFEEKLPRVYQAFMNLWIRTSHALIDPSEVPNDS